MNGNENRGQVFAAGLFIAYGTRKFTVALKYQREMFVRNRPEGNRIWLQMYMPFGQGAPGRVESRRLATWNREKVAISDIHVRR